MDKREKFLEIQKAHFEMMESYHDYMKILLFQMAEEVKESKEKRLSFFESNTEEDDSQYEKISQSQEQLRRDLEILRIILDDPSKLKEEEIYKTNEPMKPSSEIWEEENCKKKGDS